MGEVREVPLLAHYPVPSRCHVHCFLFSSNIPFTFRDIQSGQFSNKRTAYDTVQQSTYDSTLEIAAIVFESV